MSLLSSAKKLAIGALSAGTTMLLAACYGPMHPRSRHMHSSVTDAEGRGVRNIKVCLKAENMEVCQPTRYLGRFTLPNKKLLWTKAQEYGVTICAMDIDGPENGTFEKRCQYYPPKRLPRYVTFRLHERR